MLLARINGFIFRAKMSRLQRKLDQLKPAPVTEAEQWSRLQMDSLLSPSEDAPDAPVVLTPTQSTFFYVGCAMGVMMPTYCVIAYGSIALRS